MSRDPKSTYYDAGGIETLDVIKAKLTPEQYRGYLLGNAIKYACRLNFKGSAERDAEKLAVYSKELAELPKAQEEQDHTHQQPASSEVTGPVPDGTRHFDSASMAMGEHLTHIGYQLGHVRQTPRGDYAWVNLPPPFGPSEPERSK